MRPSATNPFMSPEMLADKVCWWISQAVAEAEARGAEKVLARVEALIRKWTGCWCGEQLAYDHDPRVQDCPQHGDGAAEHFCGAIVTDLRAALTEDDA
jgi:hypothetical protein